MTGGNVLASHDGDGDDDGDDGDGDGDDEYTRGSTAIAMFLRQV